jgi:membrane fusion protein
MPLFRSESEQARAGAWLGRILVVRPISFAALTLAALAICAALMALFLLGEYTRKARVSGFVSPAAGIVRVVSPQAGVIDDIDAEEGARVERGRPLLQLADARKGSALRDVAAAVASQMAQRRRVLARQRDLTVAAMHSEQQALDDRRTGIRREIERIDAEIERQAERARIAEAASGRSRRLEDVGFVSAAGADRDRDAALDQEGRLETARRSRLSLLRELAGVEHEMQAAVARALGQAAGIDLQRAALEQEQVERELQYAAAIVAPASGVVATVLVERGQTVAAGMTLATIIPEGAALEAHLFAPSRSIGFVHPGQEVMLRYLAYPHQKFGSHRARVIAVSRSPMLPAELGFTPIDGTREPVYRIKVALDEASVAAYGHREPLQPGMQVEADILLDRRRLIEWVFEPLLSLAGRA